MPEHSQPSDHGGDRTSPRAGAVTAVVEVRDNPKADRYEAWVGNELAGFAEYRPAGNRLVFVHTEVLPAFVGRGIGSRLAAGALDSVRSRGLKVTPRCPFIAAYIRSHPGYADLVVGRSGSSIEDGPVEPGDTSPDGAAPGG